LIERCVHTVEQIAEREVDIAAAIGCLVTELKIDGRVAPAPGDLKRCVGFFQGNVFLFQYNVVGKSAVDVLPELFILRVDCRWK